MSELQQVLADKIIDYIRNTIRGTESGTYKVAAGIKKVPNVVVDLDMITSTEQMQGYITVAISEYFNGTWESLVVKNNPNHPKYDT